MLFWDNFSYFSIEHVLRVLKAPHQGTSNEYYNICLYRELEKIISELSSNTTQYFDPGK